MSQRLARVLCPECRTFSAPTDDEIELLTVPDADPIVEVARPVGCSACGNTGYRGRQAIYEIMLLDDDIRSLIARRAAAPEIEDAAIAGGMLTLRQAGVRRVRAGLFGPDELIRVLS